MKFEDYLKNIGSIETDSAVYTVDQLEKVFCDYVELVKRELKTGDYYEGKVASLRVLSNIMWGLNQQVRDLESTEEFRSLINAAEQFAASEACEIVAESERWYSGWTSILSELAYLASHYGVCNFLRRSGLYNKVFFGESVNTSSFYHKFYTELTKSECTVIYLIPIVSASFAGEHADFGDFRVKQFSIPELQAIFSNDINRLFYPGAYLSEDRLKNLANLWFVQIEKNVPIRKYIPDQKGWVRDHKEVPFSYSMLPSDVEEALKSWVLLTDSLGEYYRILNTLTVDNCLFGFPRTMTFHELDHFNSGAMWCFALNEKQTNGLFEDVRRYQNLLQSLYASFGPIDYLDRSFGYAIKALTSGGLEELLSCITALEALLGDKNEVVSSIARRISAILGSNDKERKAIHKTFRELYDIRCVLVHGKPFRNSINVKHLRTARDMLRNALSWYLHFLNGVSKKTKDGSRKKPLSRQEALRLIDLFYEGDTDFKLLSQILPSGFPYVENWIRPK